MKDILSDDSQKQQLRREMGYPVMILNNCGSSDLELFWNCFGIVMKADSGKTKGGISAEVRFRFCADFGRKEAITAFHFVTFFSF